MNMNKIIVSEVNGPEQVLNIVTTNAAGEDSASTIFIFLKLFVKRREEALC